MTVAPKKRGRPPLPRNKRRESVDILRFWIKRFKKDLEHYGLKGYGRYAVKELLKGRI